VYKISVPNVRRIFGRTGTSAREYIGRLHGRVGACISRMFPDVPPDIESVKEEIWADLSAVYYKYDYDFHKRAFRDVMIEVSDKLSEGKWSTVYKRMYRTNKVASFPRML